ncbi:uncharacterized protein MKK02DRAFT_32135 [Dioszegia hungarica]|uniref:Uncharacterized protein n=1 Tax=Dioszegia hungarica TaxID=4972 RepID=A0AA38HBG9_9TREE|nr:uncharacterized protein MKK02DRAFT_32135 [Dioszegia hungarica]KAI9637251.1 hypothetical protein MKK02DRAFT_32135 [Dioszegia hungarica]
MSSAGLAVTEASYYGSLKGVYFYIHPGCEPLSDIGTAHIYARGGRFLSSLHVALPVAEVHVSCVMIVSPHCQHLEPFPVGQTTQQVKAYALAPSSLANYMDIMDLETLICLDLGHAPPSGVPYGDEQMMEARLEDREEADTQMVRHRMLAGSRYLAEKQWVSLELGGSLRSEDQDMLEIDDEGFPVISFPSPSMPQDDIEMDDGGGDDWVMYDDQPMAITQDPFAPVAKPHTCFIFPQLFPPIPPAQRYPLSLFRDELWAPKEIPYARFIQVVPTAAIGPHVQALPVDPARFLAPASAPAQHDYRPLRKAAAGPSPLRESYTAAHVGGGSTSVPAASKSSIPAASPPILWLSPPFPAPQPLPVNYPVPPPPASALPSVATTSVAGPSYSVPHAPIVPDVSAGMRRSLEEEAVEMAMQEPAGKRSRPITDDAGSRGSYIEAGQAGPGPSTIAATQARQSYKPRRTAPVNPAMAERQKERERQRRRQENAEFTRQHAMPNARHVRQDPESWGRE